MADGDIDIVGKLELDGALEVWCAMCGVCDVWCNVSLEVCDVR